MHTPPPSQPLQSSLLGNARNTYDTAIKKKFGYMLGKGNARDKINSQVQPHSISCVRMGWWWYYWEWKGKERQWVPGSNTTQISKKFPAAGAWSSFLQKSIYQEPIRQAGPNSQGGWPWPSLIFSKSYFSFFYICNLKSQAPTTCGCWKCRTPASQTLQASRIVPTGCPNFIPSFLPWSLETIS